MATVKLIVMHNGQRVSNVVHEGITREDAMQSAEKEKNALTQKLLESAHSDEQPVVEIKELLLG